MLAPVVISFLYSLATDPAVPMLARATWDAIKARFNASNLIGTPLGDTDFMYAVADGPAMLVQYGNKKKLCEGLAALPAPKFAYDVDVPDAVPEEKAVEMELEPDARAVNDCVEINP